MWISLNAKHVLIKRSLVLLKTLLKVAPSPHRFRLDAGRLEVRDQQVDDQQSHQIGRARDDEQRYVAAHPLKQVTGCGCDQHAADRTGPAADADHRSYCATREHV